MQPWAAVLTLQHPTNTEPATTHNNTSSSTTTNSTHNVTNNNNDDTTTTNPFYRLNFAAKQLKILAMNA